MPRLILLDQHQVAYVMPRALPDAQARRAARLIDTPQFRGKLARAVRAAMRRHPELAEIRVRVSG